MNAILKKILPTIGTALEIGFPPFGGMAAAAISAVTGVSNVTPENAEKVIAEAQAKDPEILLKLKQADQEFALSMQRLGIESEIQFEQIAATDRASARAREIAVKDKTPMILAFAVVLGFFGLLAAVAFHTVEQASMPILQIMIGALGAAFTGIVSYFFGSSAGSARKTETISRIATGP